MEGPGGSRQSQWHLAALRTASLSQRHGWGSEMRSSHKCLASKAASLCMQMVIPIHHLTNASVAFDAVVAAQISDSHPSRSDSGFELHVHNLRGMLHYWGGVADCICRAGFIGGTKTLEGAIQMAQAGLKLP